MREEEFDRLLRSALCQAAMEDYLPEDESVHAPPELEERIFRALEEAETAEAPAGPSRRPLLRALRAAACLLLVAGLSMGCLMTLSPDARAWAVQFLTQRHPTNNSYDFRGEGEMLDVEEWRPAYIPEGFTLVEEWGFGEGEVLDLRYENAEEQWLTVGCRSGNMSSSTGIDNEHSTESRVKVGPYDATLLTSIGPEYPSYLIWLDGDRGAAFMVMGYVGPEELMKIARSMSGA